MNSWVRQQYKIVSPFCSSIKIREYHHFGIYVCMYVCMYICIYIYMYVCMYVCVTFYRKRSMCFLQLNFIGLQWRMFTTDVHNSGNDWWTVGWGSNIKLSLLSVHQLKSVNITILEYMYVCMYVCIYVYIYICMYVCMYVWPFTGRGLCVFYSWISSVSNEECLLQTYTTAVMTDEQLGEAAI